MAGEQRSLQAAFADAENIRSKLDHAPSTAASEYQDILATAISAYNECLLIADRVSLFSPNESLEDINSGDLQYLLLNYRIALLVGQRIGGDRKAVLAASRNYFDRFLRLLDTYDILSKDNSSLYEHYTDDKNHFAVVTSKDPATRRDAKIGRFRQEKELKAKLELLRRNPKALEDDDDALRKLHFANVELALHDTFGHLESMALEFDILNMAPPQPPPGEPVDDDARSRTASGEGYSDRLDGPISQFLTSKTGPILSKDGRPLRPFTLLDSRQRLQKGVFRPDHNLPTMSIDEYLDEERRRGGIIEGGGEKSGLRPEPEEDNVEKADAETMKQRAWDDFKDENPKGSGNTLNRG